MTQELAGCVTEGSVRDVKLGQGGINCHQADLRRDFQKVPARCERQLSEFAKIVIFFNDAYVYMS
jgi:hypothetical protein